MPLTLSQENTKHMSDYQLLLHTVKTYANKSSYEPYEKDTGEGSTEITPGLARRPHEYAQHCLELLDQRYRNQLKNRKAWLWALLFGPLYFAYKGAWIWAIIALIAAFITVGLSHLIMPIFARNIVNKHEKTPA